MANNPRLVVIANEAKHPSLRTNAVSEAISKGIDTTQQEIASGFAHRNDVDCFALSEKGLAMTCVVLRASPIAMTKTNEGEAVPASPPSASLTQLTPFPSLLKKRGVIRIIFFLLFPLSNSVREGELKGVSKKKRGAIRKLFYSIVPPL